MSEPVRNFKQIIRIKGTGDDAYPNPGTLMLWGDNWTLLDWIRQHTDYSKDTRTTPVDVDVLTRLHEYATGIANQNGRHDVRRGEAACIVAGVESSIWTSSNCCRDCQPTLVGTSDDCGVKPYPLIW